MKVIKNHPEKSKVFVITYLDVERKPYKIRCCDKKTKDHWVKALN